MGTCWSFTVPVPSLSRRSGGYDDLGAQQIGDNCERLSRATTMVVSAGTCFNFALSLNR